MTESVPNLVLVLILTHFSEIILWINYIPNLFKFITFILFGSSKVKFFEYSNNDFSFNFGVMPWFQIQFWRHKVLLIIALFLTKSFIFDISFVQCFFNEFYMIRKWLDETVSVPYFRENVFLPLCFEFCITWVYLINFMLLLTLQHYLEYIFI